MGGNPDAAQRLGFNLFRLHLLVYGYMGFIAGIASLVQAQLAQSVAPTVLVGKELDVLAAVVLGGASLLGGVGTVLGTMLGLTLLAITAERARADGRLVLLLAVLHRAVDPRLGLGDGLVAMRQPRSARRRAGMSGERPPLDAGAAASPRHLRGGQCRARRAARRPGRRLHAASSARISSRAGALRSMALQMPELGILSLAMMITLLAGGLNLAIIATANLCALTMAYVLTAIVPGSEGFAWGAWQVIAVLAGFAVAAVIGVINGYVIAYLNVSPILATLGTMTMVKGISIGLTRGNVISGLSRADRLHRQRRRLRHSRLAAGLHRLRHPAGGAAQPRRRSATQSTCSARTRRRRAIPASTPGASR